MAFAIKLQVIETDEVGREKKVLEGNHFCVQLQGVFSALEDAEDYMDAADSLIRSAHLLSRIPSY